jgi:hypothetical protein
MFTHTKTDIFFKYTTYPVQALPSGQNVLLILNINTTQFHISNILGINDIAISMLFEQKVAL